jgi:hypothetical protein
MQPRVDKNDDKVTCRIPKTLLSLTGKKYEFLAAGAFNYVYTYFKNGKKMVLKIQRDTDDAGIKYNDHNLTFDNPKRSIELWNSINPNVSPPAALHPWGWTCPYIIQNASDQEIYECLIDIFNRTGRVVTDAHRDNFRKTPEGEVACIDPGFVLQFEKRDTPFPERARRRSEISLSFGSLNSHIKFLEKQNEEKKIEIIIPQLIKALIIIKNHRPDMINVDVLKTDFTLLDQLAEAYYDDTHLLPMALESLDRAIDLMKENKHEQESKDTQESQKLLTENNVKKQPSSANYHRFFCPTLKINWKATTHKCAAFMSSLRKTAKK